MAIDVTDGFEAASLDSMWVQSVAGGYALASDYAQAGTKSLKYQYPASTLQMAIWDATDANEGDVQIRSDIRWNNGADTLIAVLMARRSASNTPFTSGQHYGIQINPRSTKMCYFKRWAEGASTYVGDSNGYVNKSAFTAGDWYRFTLRCYGDGPVTLGLLVQRMSDSYYLQSNGSTWASGEYVLEVEDSSGYIRGKGYTGIASNIAVGSSDRLWYDNVRIEGLIVEKLKTTVQTVVADATVHAIPVTGQLTSWTTGAGGDGVPQFEVSGGDAIIVGQNITSATEAVLYVDTGATAGTLTLTDPSTGKTRTVEMLAPSQVIAYDDDALLYSPLTWQDTGSGRRSINPGSYVRFKISGTTFLRLKAETSAYETLTDSDCPRLAVRHGDSEYTQVDFDTTTQVYTLLSGLDDTKTYEIEVFYVSHNINSSIWSGVGGVTITEWQVSEGGSVSAPTSRSKKAVMFGPSTSYGVSSIPDASGAIRTRHDARYGPAFFLAQMMKIDCAPIGFGSQGYGKAGAGGVPAVTTAWQYYRSGQSRLSGGAFVEDVDWIFLTHGAADFTGSVSGSAVQSGATSLVQSVRAAAPDAKIFLCVPIGGHYRSQLTAVYTALSADDANLFLIDPALEIEHALSTTAVGETYWSIDGIHLRESAAAIWAGALAKLVEGEVEEPVADDETITAEGDVFEVVSGGDAPAYALSLAYADGTIPNLVGATVTFRMRRYFQTDTQISESMTVLNAAAGTVSYTWQEGDLDVAGRYGVNVVVALASGKTVVFSGVDVLIKEGIAV